MDLKATLSVVVDATGARSGAEAAMRAFDMMKRRGEDAISSIDSSFAKLKDSIFSLKTAFGALLSGALVKSFIDAGKETETYTIRLQLLLGSVEKGKQLFKDMNTYAAQTPFNFREVMGAATTLAGVLKGGNEEIKAMMPMIGDLAAASGLGIQETTGQIVKMLSAGAGAADMFRERGILAMMGFQQGVQYSAKQTREILINSWESATSKFRGATKLLINTWEGAVSNLEDSWFQFQQRVMVDGGVLTYLRSIVQVLNDRFTTAFGSATGAAETFATSTIAGLEYVVRGIGAIIEAARFAVVAFEAIKTASSGFSAAWVSVTVEVNKARAAMTNAQAEEAGQIFEKMKKFGTDAQIEKAEARYREALKSAKEANQDLSNSYKDLEKTQEDNGKQLEELFGAYQKFEAGVNLDGFLDEVTAKFAENMKAGEADAKRIGEFKSGLKEMGGQAGMTAQEMYKFNEAAGKATDIIDSLNNRINQARADSDPSFKATADYLKAKADIIAQEKELQQLMKETPKLGLTEAKIHELITNALDAEAQARDDEIEKRKREMDIAGQFLSQLKRDDALIGLTGKSLAVAQAVQQVTQSWEAMSEGWKRAHPLSEIVTDDFKRQVEASYDLHDAYDKTRQIQEEYADNWSTMFNSMAQHSSQFFTGQIKSWKDFGKAILGDITQLVQQMIFQWMKLQFVNPILNNMFGGMMNLPTMANAGGGGFMSMFGGGGGSLANAIGSGGATGGGGLMDSLSSIYTMGSNFFSGGTGLAAAGPYAATPGMIGPYVPGAGMGEMGFVPNYAGGAPATVGAQGASAYNPMGGYTNIGGWQASTMGLMGAGMGLSYGLRRGDGRWGTAASGVAGAVGGYTLGAAAGAAGGVMLAGGGAAAAGTAALGAIPVVGWIALAALAIDKISGGKLFGTKFRPKEMTSTIGIGAEGGTASNSLFETRQGALFSGMKKRTRDIAATEEQNAAAADLFKNVKETMVQAAAKFGVEVPPVIEATFKTITEYTKKGKVKSEKTVSEFGGVKYEESFEQFQKRATAEGIIKVLGAIDGSADQVAGAFRKDADKLLDAATTMGAVLEDFKSGKNLLGANASLKDTMDIVSELAKDGETLANAYARLQAATKSFSEIIDTMGVKFDKTGADLVRFVDEFTTAAGGGDKANALLQSFHENFFTDEEKKKNTTYDLQLAAMREGADLGSAGKGLTFENFRERFTELLPKLSASEVKEWLEAGDALAQLAKATGSTRLAVMSAGDAIKAYGRLTSDFADMQVVKAKSFTQLLQESQNDLINQASAYDGSIESESKLIGMIQDRYNMEMSYLAMIKNIQDGINNSLDAQIESLKTSKMDDQGKYEYFRQQANALSDQLMQMTDPEEIGRTVQRINEYEQAAYNTLSPEQQSALVDDFINFLTKIEDVANAKLEGAKDDVKTQSETISEAIETALTRVAERQQQAADKQDQAADKILEAANTPQPIDVRVTLVGGGGGRGEVGGLY